MLVHLIKHDGDEERKSVPDGSTVEDVFSQVVSDDFTVMLDGIRAGPQDRLRNGSKVVVTHNKMAAA